MASNKTSKSKSKSKSVESVEVSKALADSAPPKPERDPSNLTEEGALKLNDLERLRLNWQGAEMRAAASALKIKNMEYDFYLKKVDPAGLVRKYLAEISALTDSHKSCQNDFIESSKKVAEKLNIDPKFKWSYDDETGLIHMEEDEPVSSEKTNAAAVDKK